MNLRFSVTAPSNALRGCDQNRLTPLLTRLFLDGLLFAFGFLLAALLRSNPYLIDRFDLQPAEPALLHHFWLVVLVAAGSPFILKALGFYDRPTFGRSNAAWRLLKAFVAATIGLIVILYLTGSEIPRWIPIGFGVVTFVLVSLKEELFLLVAKIWADGYRK